MSYHHNPLLEEDEAEDWYCVYVTLFHLTLLLLEMYREMWSKLSEYIIRCCQGLLSRQNTSMLIICGSLKCSEKMTQYPPTPNSYTQTKPRCVWADCPYIFHDFLPLFAPTFTIFLHDAKCIYQSCRYILISLCWLGTKGIFFLNQMLYTSYFVRKRERTDTDDILWCDGETQT